MVDPRTGGEMGVAGVYGIRKVEYRGIRFGFPQAGGKVRGTGWGR